MLLRAYEYPDLNESEYIQTRITISYCISLEPKHYFTTP